MRTVKQERTNVEMYEIYVAADGTEFTSAEECKKYEKSAYGVLNARYQALVVNKSFECAVFCQVGCEDNAVEAVRIKSREDADLVLQMYFFINPELLADNANEYRKKRVEEIKAYVQRALDEQDILIVGHGYEYNDSLWILGTASSVKESIDAFAFANA